MNQRHQPAIQDAIRQRRRQTFVGRENQLDLFREQLTLPWDADRRRYVLNVWGQGGVGKSTLLGEYRRLAGQAGALSALVDRDDKDAPAAMGRLAAQLLAAGGPDATLAFQKFTERHAAYQKKRGELETDPDAPQGLAGLFAGAATRLGAKLLRNSVPGSDIALDLVEQPLAEQASLWAEFARRKLGNRDEVQLVLEPETVLTPLFLRALGELCAARRVVLLFDTYELTAGALDGWLRDLLGGRHGDAPADLTLVVAGRHELDRNAWAELEELVARLPLEPFTEAEARDYLARKDVTNEQVINVILTLSGRLPLLLATLAAASPNDPARVGDATGTAVGRFLSWVDDPARRALARNGALPRRLNRDVVGLLGGDATGFDWLIGQPFVQRRPAGDWAYHDVAREQMLRYKRAESPAEWTALHEKLAEHYRAARDALGLTLEAGMSDPAWRAAALGDVYHRLCARPQRELGAALNAFAAMLDTQFSAAGAWAAAMAAAGRDTGHKPLSEWGESLGDGLNAYEAGDREGAIEAFGRLASSPLLEATNRATVLHRRGLWRRQIEQYDAALADFDRAIELNPDYTSAFTSRATTYDMTTRYNEALADYSRAIELDPSNPSLFLNRAWFYQRGVRDEEALADYKQAIELDPREPGTFLDRARFYQQRGLHKEALADYNRAIELDPGKPRPYLNRAQFYQQRKQHKAAVADYSRAIELNPSDPSPFLSRAQFYQDREQFKEAVADYSRAIELDPSNPWYIIYRGRFHQRKEQYEAALADYSRAIELAPRDPWYILDRARFYEERERYEDALADYSRIIELDPSQIWRLLNRAHFYEQRGLGEAALADYNRAIELEPRDPTLFLNRALLYQKGEQYEAALADYNRAIELSPRDPDLLLVRALLYQQRGQYEAALADYNRIIELDPSKPDPFLDRARFYQQREQYNEALADYSQAIELAPSNPSLFFSRARFYQERERYEEALADYSRAIELDPGKPGPYQDRARFYQERERYEEALADFDQAIKLNADDVWAIANRAWIHASRGDMQRLLGQHAAALVDYNQALELEPDYVWAITRRGETRNALGQYEEALVDFDRAIALTPETDWCRYQRGITRRRLNEADAWRDDLDAAIRSATAAYQANPADANNLFNLAVYYVAAGDAEAAETRYQDGLAQQPHAAHHRMAVADLEQYLALFPDDALAVRMMALLGGEAESSALSE